MIDFHTHILPEIDDGSRSIDTTAAMLTESLRQGVEVVVATPHFYAERDSVERFLKRRDAAMERVKELDQDKPEILLGAEVAWFDGISRARHIDLLRIQGTDVLLLELPFCSWNSNMIRELDQITREHQIILAHLERYLDIPGNGKAMGNILEMPLYVQINAGSLLDWRKRRRILRMFRKGQAHLLGSDCHGMNRRPPNLPVGRHVIEKKLGIDYLTRIDQQGERLLHR